VAIKYSVICDKLKPKTCYFSAKVNVCKETQKRRNIFLNNLSTDRGKVHHIAIFCVKQLQFAQRLFHNREYSAFCFDFIYFRLAKFLNINPLSPELNPICYLLALLGAHHFLHVSRIRVRLLTFRLLMSYIYGAPILDVSRSHTTTQHSR